MKKALQVKIENPCHENWENMKAAEQGRFCGSCQKNVVDFTTMTDEEVLRWITKPGKDTCGRFNSDQLQRDLIIYPEKKFSFRYLWQLMVASFLIAGRGEAQTGKPILVKTEIKKASHSNEQQMKGEVSMVLKKSFKISGTIIDSSNNNPIPYASIRIKGTSKGVQSDSAGKFVFEYDDAQQELEFSSVGYGSKTLSISNSSNDPILQMSLSPLPDMMGEVVVAGTYQRCTGMLGGYSVRGIRVTRIEQLKNYLDGLIPTKKEIVVYPNPIRPGSSINLGLDLKETGLYKLELTDASGKLLLSKSITVGNVKQQEAITTNASWSRGVYYLKISQTGKKFNKTTKVLIQ